MNEDDIPELDIRISEEAFCENCGKLDPCTAVVDDDLTTWCLDCACNTDLINNDEYKSISEMERQAQKIYYKKKLKELE